MGVWIAIAIVLFVLGNMMALKPNGSDQRIDNLRMTARGLQLNPKLVTCPDWVKGKDNEYGKGMIGQYALVLEGVRFPHARYQPINGEWRPDSSVISSTESDGSAHPLNFVLDKVQLDLPSTIEPFVKALLIKANCIVIYWEDAAYVRPSSNPGFHTRAIEPDLTVLKSQLEAWALAMQASLQRKAKSSHY